MKKKNAIILKVTISDFNTGMWYGRSLNIEELPDEKILLEIADFLDGYRKENRGLRLLWNKITGGNP